MQGTILRSRRIRWSCTGCAAVALVAAGTWAVTKGEFAVAMTADNAGDKCTAAAPPAGCHFFLVSRRGAPQYDVNATLYDQNGKSVYTWVREFMGGDSKPVLWYIAPSGGKLDIKVHGANGLAGGSVVDKPGLTADRDYCFHVDPFGYVSYKGDSLTGNCTPE